MKVLPPIHGPTLHRMLRRPRWALSLLASLFGWGWKLLSRRQRPSRWNVPFKVVNLWPAESP